jgi:hypothetical protein
VVVVAAELSASLLTEVASPDASLEVVPVSAGLLELELPQPKSASTERATVRFIRREIMPNLDSCPRRKRGAYDDPFAVCLKERDSTRRR